LNSPELNIIFAIILLMQNLILKIPVEFTCHYAFKKYSSFALKGQQMQMHLLELTGRGRPGSYD